MAVNLADQLMNDFRGDTLNRVAAAIGESPAKTTSALGSVVPALIGGLAAKATTTDGATALLNLIKGNHLTSPLFTDVAAAFNTPEGAGMLTSTGGPLLQSLFGARTGELADRVSSLAGINRSSSSSLLGLVLPLVLGLIARRLSGAGMNATGLMSLLGEQRQLLRPASAELGSLLEVPDRDRREPVPAYVAAPATRSRTWLWAVPALALIPLFLFWLARRNEPSRDVAVQTLPTSPAASARLPGDVPRPVATTGVASLGPFVATRLPNNVTLHVPANGVERKLLEYIQSPAPAAGKEVWFSFDRLEFETDSARLTPGASEQLRNITEILKAYPGVRVMIGGYTDNSADSAYNLKLSQDRATAAMSEIRRLGVDPSRIEAMGYGEAHPIADNATAEGRQRNRRVDLRVTSK